MGYICWNSDSCSRGTKDFYFIRCVDGRERQIHEISGLGFDGITSKIHPTAQVEVSSGTVGKFTTNYLYENEVRIPTVIQLSINVSVQLLGIPNFFRNNGLSFIENLQSPTVSSGWDVADTYNKNWGVIPGGPYIIFAFPWVSTIPSCLAYIPRSAESLRAAERCCTLLHAASMTNYIVKDVTSLCWYVP